MDYKTIRKNARVCGLVVVLGLLLAVPAAAAPGEPTTVYPLPMPIPIMPSVVQPLEVASIPSLSRAALPQVSGLPSRMGAISAAAATSNDVLSRAESTLDSTLTSLTSELDRSRSLVTTLRARVGSPNSDVLMVAQDASGAMVSYTAASAAATMRDSIYTSTAYLRGLSNLGGVGLNLTFIILGLGWIAVVNLLDLAVRVAVFLVKVLARLLATLLTLFDLLLQVASAIAEWLDILTGPLT